MAYGGDDRTHEQAVLSLYVAVAYAKRTASTRPCAVWENRAACQRRKGDVVRATRRPALIWDELRAGGEDGREERGRLASAPARRFATRLPQGDVVRRA